ncbi:hypothetical protein PWG71_19055 [Nocardiopsis sp. N85]|uniref:hypothetical protein n=1 Tax=Nocardiopsis sp. N85 TaxID=3029400 RepID=UPI00237FA03F|nr:hypothetical protein [Nocardiopsis sp. N85]MDE3723493.1 hypothetical protein [Nocardiopsis sp. N85]
MRASTVYALGAVMAGLLLTGCGPLGGEGDDEASGTREPTMEEAMVDFAACMRENGYDMPDPEGEGMVHLPAAGPDDEELMAAMETCENLLPVDENAPSEEEMFEENLRMAECMRENGYDMPDPERGMGLAVPVDPDDDEGMAALTRCSETARGEGNGDS